MRLRSRSVLVAAVAVALAAPAGVAAAAEPAPAAAPPIPQGWPAVLSATATSPVEIARGVTEWSESYVTADGPEHVQVLQVDISRGTVSAGTVESHDHVIDPPDELTTSMGDRTGAVAGINGDFFAIHASGAPLGGVVRDGHLLKTPRPHFAGQLSIANRRAEIGEVDFTGQVTIGDAHAPLNSVNTVEDAAAPTASTSDTATFPPARFAAPEGITEITPDLGADVAIPPATLVIAHRNGASDPVVDEVRTATTSVPALAPDQIALLGGGAGGDWLAQHATPGARLGITADLSRKGIDTLIGGATVLVRDGAVFDDPTGAPPSGRNPETMVGVGKDGRQLTMAVIDGRQPESSIGVTPQEAAEYLVAHGVDSGLLLDGGGSSTLAARLPGTAALTVLNHPSDPTGERPVANGLFVFSR